MVKKPLGDGTHKKKGRVVVCGNFQQVQPGEETCANTPSFPMLRTLISMAALYRWAVESWDVSTAFLYAPLIEKRDVYCKPRQVLVKLGLIQPGTVWKLKKALYGLRTSPRAWEEERDTKLCFLTWDSPVGKVGLKSVDTTRCVWTIRQLDAADDSPPLGMVIAYVDDLIAVGDQSQLNCTKTELDKLYVMKTSGSIPATYEPGMEPLRFLGCLIERMPDGQIIMHQRSYIEHCFRENDMELIKGGVTLPNVDEKGSPESPVDQYGHPTEFEKIKIHLSEIHWTAARLMAQDPIRRVQVSCCQLLRRMLITVAPEVCPSCALEGKVMSLQKIGSPWWRTLMAGLTLFFPHISKKPSYMCLKKPLLTLPKEKLKYSLVAELASSSNPSQNISDMQHVCKGCHRAFASYNQLRSHQFHHKCAWSRALATYDPRIDNHASDPVCAWCHRAFLWWSGLRTHIEQGQCSQMERREAYLHMLTTRNAAPPALHHDKDLNCHCVLCGRWVKLTRSLSSHLSRAHPKEYAVAKQSYKTADFSALRFRHKCPFCKVEMKDLGNMRDHVRSHCIVLLQRFLAGYPYPLNPDQPGCPPSEQACQRAVGHGEDPDVHASGRTVDSSLGGPLSAPSQTCKVRRRLRGKQRDPRHRDGRGTLQQQQAVHPETPEQVTGSTTPIQGHESGATSTCERRTACEDIGEASVAATRSTTVSHQGVWLHAAHGQKRRPWNCPQLSRGEQSVASSHVGGESSQGIPESSSIEDDHGHSCGPGGRTESDEGWGPALRLRAQHLEGVLRAGLGCTARTPYSSTRREDHDRRCSDEVSRRTLTAHSRRCLGAPESAEATSNNLCQYSVTPAP